MRDAITDPRARIAAVANHLGLSKTCSRLILRLYDAGGRYVPRQDLMAEISTLSRGTLKSDVYQMRQAVGEGIIDVQRGNSGLGYRLTVPGLSKVLCALNPP
jgi:hypothetical protein